MFFFWRLMVAHLLTDFTFQTNRIAQWKRDSIAGVIFHVMIYAIFAFAVNYDYLDNQALLLCIAITSVLHLVEDQWRVVSVARWKSPDNMTFFIWDQVIHVLSIFAFFPPPPLQPAPPSGALLPLPTEKWALLACLFIGATHFTTIALYFFRKDWTDEAAVLTREKIYGFVERGLMFGLAFLSPRLFLPALAALAVLVLLERYSLRRRREPGLDLSWTNILGGVASGLLFSWAAFAVHHGRLLPWA